MVMTDPIADMLTAIKNGYLANKNQLSMSYSKIKEGLAQILVKEGFLEKLKVISKKFKVLELTLKYEGKRPAVKEVVRISKPGLRVYAGVAKIPRVRYGPGVTIVSTSEGLMTGSEAKKKNLGGEVICQIW